MTRLYCLEPELPGSEWEPFRGARPIAELRAGAWRIRDRWAASLGTPDVRICGHAGPFADADSVPVDHDRPIRGPAVVARSDFVPAGGVPRLQSGTRRLTSGSGTVAWIVPEGETWAPNDHGPAETIPGVLLQGAWDLIRALEELLPADCHGAAAADRADPVPPGSIVLGDPAGVACFGAEVEPGVVFDVRQGAVVLEEGVKVQSGTRLEGPLFVGPNTILLGGAIRHSSIGPACRVQGEVTSTVFLGYGNKSHDGFVGHSVIGQWVNLGAGSITSNLKNTYGEIRLELEGGRVSTGRMNLGTLFGDHSKTAIGTLLSAGTIVGTGAQVLQRNPARVVPPFSWGDQGRKVDLEGFLTIARRVMPRRKVTVSGEIEASLRDLHRRLCR